MSSGGRVKAAAGEWRPVFRPYALIPVAERQRARAVQDELLDAARDGRREGWHEDEGDVVRSKARELGVTLWPTLLRRLLREAHFG